MGKLYFSSVPLPEQIWRNQTKILAWLERMGHKVEYAPGYRNGSRPSEAPLGVAVLHHQSELQAFVGDPCPYCGNAMEAWGRRAPSREHKTPKSRGGRLDEHNKLIVCSGCNNDKDRMTVEEWFNLLRFRGDPRAERVGWIMLAETKGRGASAR